MNLLDRMNTVIDYVETHITDEIKIDILAQLAYCSSFNFQRMFSFTTDMSIVEYIRRRRLSLAALELQNGDAKVIDVALKYGYDSPVSFAKAFRLLHGVTPSEAKKSNVSLKMFPRMTFQIIIKGVNQMEYRIVKTQSFKVFGIEGIISSDKFSSVGEMWRECQNNGKYDKLALDAGIAKFSQHDNMFVKDMCRVHGLMNYKQMNSTDFAYMLCSFLTQESQANGYEIFEVPETIWAVFPAELNNWNVGEAIEKFNRTFYSEWLPTSEYEKADSPEFEMYGGTPEKGYIEFWMPIIKKEPMD